MLPLSPRPGSRPSARPVGRSDERLIGFLTLARNPFRLYRLPYPSWPGLTRPSRGTAPDPRVKPGDDGWGVIGLHRILHQTPPHPDPLPRWGSRWWSAGTAGKMAVATGD